MKINWKEQTLKYNHLSINFAAARNLIRAAFPDLVSSHLVKTKMKGKVLYPIVDWKPIFLNPAIQCFLMEYLGDEPIGLCTGYDTINKRLVKFFAQEDYACVFIFPPQKIKLELMAKVVNTEDPLTKEQNTFYERYYT